MAELADLSTERRVSLDLDRMGFNERFRALFEPLADDGFIPGRVTRIDRGLPIVATWDGVARVEPAAHLLKASDRAANRFAVGDWVALSLPEGHDMGIVEAILPRSSAFSRRDPGDHSASQVVATNVDTVFVMQTMREPNLRRLERELVLAWDSGARPVVVLSKADLCLRSRETVLEEVVAVCPGVDVHATSGVTGEGTDAIARYLLPGQTGAMLGASGVGKSTLINRIVGARLQRTAEVRASDGRGRHVTVAREMLLIPGGGVVIDTPGLRGLALWDAAEGIAAAFSDIVEAASRCRFRDCRHLDEPGCAVLAAIETGAIPERRLVSYRDLSAELEETERRRTETPRRGGTGGSAPADRRRGGR